jgi:signal-transduction protein with cAMP-binding, CBS, and nucleotidyltransferase domain
VKVELDTEAVGDRRDRLFEAAIEEAFGEPEGMTVGDVMSDDLLLAAPDDTLGEVAERMRERDTGGPALVAEYGRLIGILTSRDMLRALAGRVHPSEARVRHWMTADPIAVVTATTLEAARILMTEHDTHHLPVVEARRPVGMVGMRDVVRGSTLFGAGVGLGF